MGSILNIKLPSIIMLCASPGSGKSYWIRNFIYQQLKHNPNQWDYIIAFCGSKYDGDYDFIQDEFVHPFYDENVLSTFINMHKAYGCPPAVIILDDVLGEINFQSPLWKIIISQYRHLNLTILFGIQHLYALANPLIYKCSTYAILFNQQDEKTIKALYSYWGQTFKNWKEFKEFLDLNTGNYKTLICDTRQIEKEKKFIPYKAPARKPNFLVRMKRHFFTQNNIFNH